MVRALKAKRGARRRGADRRPRPPSSTTSPAEHKATDNAPSASSAGDGLLANTELLNHAGDGSDPDAIARASADDADALATGLRRGLSLRDEVVTSVEAGELYQGEACTTVRGVRGCHCRLWSDIA